MTRLASIVSAALLLVPAGVATAQQQTGTASNTGSPAPSALTADQIVANIQAFYDRTTDFEADFVQVSRQALAGTQERRAGHVRFQKPGRMRWDYTQPPGDVIVSDGNTIWLYEAAAHQVIQSSMSQSQLPSALSFLTGTGQLSATFNARMLDARQMLYPQGYVLELRPVQPNPSFERVLFYVEPGHFQVVRTVVVDAQGNTNRFDFTNVRVNVTFPGNTFQWSPPAGTQVVRP